MRPASKLKLSVILIVLCIGILYGVLHFLQGMQGKIAGEQKEKRFTPVSFPSSPKAPQIKAEIADTTLTRMIGLMNRTALGENEGMLFVFERPQRLSFWMKDTLIPLDMIFIGEDKKVINIESAEPCTSLICPRYSSEGEAQYVVEVNGGFAKKYGLKAGDMAEFQA